MLGYRPFVIFKHRILSFSQVFYQSAFLPAVYKSSHCSTSSPTVGIFSLIHLYQSGRYKISHYILICFFWITNEQLFMFILHLHIFETKKIPIFCHFSLNYLSSYWFIQILYISRIFCKIYLYHIYLCKIYKHIYMPFIRYSLLFAPFVACLSLRHIEFLLQYRQICTCFW